MAQKDGPAGWGLQVYFTSDEHEKIEEIARQSGTRAGLLVQDLVRKFLDRPKEEG